MRMSVLTSWKREVLIRRRPYSGNVWTRSMITLTKKGAVMNWGGSILKPRHPLSRVQDSEMKEGNAGTVHRRANEALKERGITCLGVNSKGNGRYQLLF